MLMASGEHLRGSVTAAADWVILWQGRPLPEHYPFPRCWCSTEGLGQKVHGMVHSGPDKAALSLPFLTSDPATGEQWEAEQGRCRWGITLSTSVLLPLLWEFHKAFPPENANYAKRRSRQCATVWTSERKNWFHVLGHTINQRHHKQKVHPSSYRNAFVTLEDRNYEWDLKTKFPFPTLFSKAPSYGRRPRHTSSRDLFSEVTKATAVTMNG